MLNKNLHLRQPSSSLPSLQSSIPSHLYVSCIHCLRSAHLNCVGEQVIGGQPSSSWLSKQSLSPSHTHVCGIQCPDRGQVNYKTLIIYYEIRYILYSNIVIETILTKSNHDYTMMHQFINIITIIIL